MTAREKSLTFWLNISIFIFDSKEKYSNIKKEISVSKIVQLSS